MTDGARDGLAWDGEPEFGERDPAAHYRERPGAYALMVDGAGRIAVVETPQGVHLPGGGRDDGESNEVALQREVREECGFGCVVRRVLGVAIEYVRVDAERACYRKRGLFFLADAGEALGGGVEPGHRLRWVDPDEAIALLRHGSHAWVVSRWRAFTPGAACPD